MPIFEQYILILISVAPMCLRVVCDVSSAQSATALCNWLLILFLNNIAIIINNNNNNNIDLHCANGKHFINNSVWKILYCNVSKIKWQSFSKKWNNNQQCFDFINIFVYLYLLLKKSYIVICASKNRFFMSLKNTFDYLKSRILDL